MVIAKSDAKEILQRIISGESIGTFFMQKMSIHKWSEKKSLSAQTWEEKYLLIKAVVKLY